MKRSTPVATPARQWLAALLLFAAVVVAYGPVIRDGGYVWDDDDYILENRTLRDLDGLGQIWFGILDDPLDYPLPQYYPVVHSVFWMEYRLWKLDARGFHLVNVLFHGLNGILLWLALRRLSVPGAWVAAAAFALHPVHVESVAWIAELKNVLSLTFYLAALLAWLRFDPPDREADPTGRRWGLYGLALGCFVLALLSKTITATLPVVLLLLAWWKRGKLGRHEILPTLPLFALGAGLGWITAWMEKHVVGAMGQEWAFPWIDRLLIAGRAVWFYAAKLLWPHPIVYIYPKWPIHSAWSWLLTLAAIAVPVALWLLRGRIGRAPLVGVLAFVAGVAPTLGFIPHFLMRYFFVADHFQYLGSIPLIALVVGLAACGLARVGASPTLRAALAVLALLHLGSLTWIQGHAYADEATLWRDTLTKNPESWVAHHNLGQILLVQGAAAEAVGHFEEALRIAPRLAEAHNNLGIALVRLGRDAEAAPHFEQALRLDPRLADAHINFGISLADRGRIDEAARHFEEAARLRPDLGGAHYNLGLIRLHQGRAEQAVRHLEQAVALESDDPLTRLQFGHALVRAGRPAEAAEQYRHALRLQPGWIEAERALSQLTR